MPANPAILQATATKTASWTGATITIDEPDTLLVTATLASFTGTGTTHQPFVQGSEDGSAWTALLNEVAAVPWAAQTTNMAASTQKFRLSTTPNCRYIRAGGTVVLVKAVGTLTGDGTIVVDGATVTVGTRVYRFKDIIAQIDDVFIGASAAAALTNFFKAINASGVAGTDYYTGTTVNTQVVATNPTATTVVLTAIAAGTGGNAIATTETSTHLSFGGVVLAGGVDHSSSVTLTCQTPNAAADSYEPDGFRV